MCNSAAPLDDPGRAVGGCGDHPASKSILLVDGNGIEVDPIHHTQRVLQIGLWLGRELFVEVGGAATHLHATGQNTLTLATTLHTILRIK